MSSAITLFSIYFVVLAAFALGAGWSMTLMSSASFLILIATVAGGLTRSFPEKKLFWLGCILVLWYFSYLAFRYDAGVATKNIGFLLPLLCPLFSVAAWQKAKAIRFSQKQIEVLIILGFTGLLLNFGLCVYQSVGLGFLRVSGFLKNPVYLSMNALVFLCFYCEQRRKISLWKKPYLDWMFAFGEMVAFLTVVLSGTRYGILVAILFVAFYEGHTLYALFKKNIWVAGAGLLALIVLVFELVHSKLGQRFLDLATNLEQDKSAMGRQEIWKINWQLFKQNPLLGTGYMQNGLNLRDWPQLAGVLSPDSQAIFAHNQFLQSLVEGGLLGFAATLAYFVGLYRLSANGSRSLFILLIALGLTDSPLTVSRFVYAWVFFIILSSFLRAPAPEGVRS